MPTKRPRRRNAASGRSAEITDDGPGTEVADFEEYTWLYLESWTDPDVRWLMSTVGSSMIFDDHDVRDDWNTSHEWREEMQQTSWWQERIVGGLSTYWIYQHLGNLGPDELHDNDLYQQVRAQGSDVAPLLREFAAHADAEADGAKGTRWSYRRDFGRVRLLMIDSRCGRILADRQRSMISRDEFAWIEKQTDGDYDHLLIGTSLPWLLGRALHDVEAWDEVLCDGKRRQADGTVRSSGCAALPTSSTGRRSASRSRRSANSSRTSVAVPTRRRRSACCPATCTTPTPPRRTSPSRRASRVYQLTCSPLHNYVPFFMKIAFRIFWSRFVERTLHLLLGVVARVPKPSFTWTASRRPVLRQRDGRIHRDRPARGNPPAQVGPDQRRRATQGRRPPGSRVLTNRSSDLSALDAQRS